MSQTILIRHFFVAMMTATEKWKKNSCPTIKKDRAKEIQILYKNEIDMNATTCGCVLNLQENHFFIYFFFFFVFILFLNICSCWKMFANDCETQNEQPLPIFIASSLIDFISYVCVCEIEFAIIDGK